MKILFFSPHAYFTVHALPEALVAENLAIQGHEVVVVNCDGLFKKHCLCMPHIPFSDYVAKQKICEICKKNRDGANKEFLFRSINLDEYIDKDEKNLISQDVSSLSPASYLEFSRDGIPIAQYALYEFWLNHKLSSTDIPSNLWDEYVAIFENTLATYYGMRRILRKEIPDRLTTYNSLYSVNRVTCAVAESMSIPHFTIHSGGHYKKRIQQMTIFRGIESSGLISRHSSVAHYHDTPCSQSQIKTVTEHVTELFRANSPWVYSIKSDKLNSAILRKMLNITQDQKVLLAVMRSNDERLAAKLAGMDLFNATPLFKNQFEWLTWLADFARANPQYAIIFRVHPREFPNKREQVTSQNVLAFLEFLDKFNRPNNLHINLPSDKLSLHDLLKITDVLLNNSSSAGLEGLLFGLPVIGNGDELFSFDPTLQKEPASIEDYVAYIAKASNEGWSLSRVIKAYRWLNYLFSEVSIDISDGYKYPVFSSSRPVRIAKRVYNKITRELGMVGDFSEVDSRSKPLKNANRLVYAIINNEDSHIGAFARTEIGDELSEKNEIIKEYHSLMESISSSEDQEFSDRVNACIQNNLSSI